MLALTFHIQQDRVALDVRRVSRVVPWVPLARPEGSPAWLAGLFVYGEAAVPVIDVHRLLGAGECPQRLSSRIILVPWQQGDLPPGWLGLLAARVSEIREIASPPPATNSPPAAEPDLGPVVVDGGEVLRVLDLDRLLTPEVRERLSGVCLV